MEVLSGLLVLDLLTLIRPIARQNCLALSVVELVQLVVLCFLFLITFQAHKVVHVNY